MGADLSSSDAAAVDVSIVVPVRNEAGNVAPLITEIAAALDGRWPYEIIYVNDGSTDATPAHLSEIMKQRANLRRIDHGNFIRTVRGGTPQGFAPRVARSSRRSTATGKTIRRFCRI